MKHWTEPNGIFLINLPIDWQYMNPLIEDMEEKSPYSFQLYNNPKACFQISCYPLTEISPKIAEDFPDGVPSLKWRSYRSDDQEFCIHMFFGALADQGLIGKFIYDIKLKNDEEIKEQFSTVTNILKSLVVVPSRKRKHASDLEKFDRFQTALAASYDLLDNAIKSDSYIEIIAITTNQIDAFLRLCIVISIQINNQTDNIPIKYLFQSENENGYMEKNIYDDAIKYGVIDDDLYKKLKILYKLRNRVIHRYIISDIKTRDLPSIAIDYIDTTEKVRLILRDFEDRQINCQHGIYSKNNLASSTDEDEAIKRLFFSVNEKHHLRKFERIITQDRTLKST